MTTPALENMTREHFEECGIKRFTLRTEGSDLDLELQTAEDVGTRPEGAARQPFSVIFKGPAEPVLQQSSYVLENEELGSLKLFLVPVASDDQGTEYEAVFT